MIKINDNHHNYNHNNKNNDSYKLLVCFSIKYLRRFFSKQALIVLEGVHAYITPFKIFLCFGKYALDDSSNLECVDQIWKTLEIPVKWRH